MSLFFTPDHARVGDVIPFYENGVMKPFYLKNWNAYSGEDFTPGWHMLETEDNLHFTETPTGVCGGTGSVINVNGTYHMFYCTFQQNPQRQFICHAISADLKAWQPLIEETFGPDEEIYLLTDWRDPFVFFNEEENCWWMLVCAQSQGKTKRRGCVGLCKSEDLHTWRQCQPLYSPEECMSAYECPDMFQMNGWWYLVFSQFTDRFGTLYRMAKSPKGPWIRPDVDTFDARAYYAAKTGVDKYGNRYIYGWNPSRTNDQWKFNPHDYPGYDYNTWDWGGSLVVHKLRQNSDGTLAVEPIPALEGQLPVKNRLHFVPLNGNWSKTTLREENVPPLMEKFGEIHTTRDVALSVSDHYGYSEAITTNDVPKTCMFECSFTFTPGTERIGIALQVDEKMAEGYYFYFEPGRQRVEYKGPLRMKHLGGWTFQNDVELERPVQLLPGKKHHVQIFVDGTVVVLYFDNSVALSTRAYDYHDRKFGLVVSQGEAEFTDIRLLSEKSTAAK